jgi:hypothetical protein
MTAYSQPLWQVGPDVGVGHSVGLPNIGRPKKNDGLSVLCI